MDPFGEPLDPTNANDDLRPPLQLRRARRDEMLDVPALRRLMRLTQRDFAAWFGFSLATLKHWERGNRQPTGSALVLLAVIHDNPRAVFRVVRKLRARRPSLLPPVVPTKSYRAPPGLGERRPPRRPRGPRHRTWE